MKRIAAIVTAILTSVVVCFGQSVTKLNKNSFSIEVGKTGLIYSLNFDHKLDESNFGFRITAGSNLGKYLNVLTTGGGGYFLVGKQKRFVELGMDVQYLIVDEVSDDQKVFSFVYPNYSIKTIYPSLNIGCRLYAKTTMFRVGFSPGLIERKIIPGGYVSYGFTF